MRSFLRCEHEKKPSPEIQGLKRSRRRAASRGSSRMTAPLSPRGDCSAPSRKRRRAAALPMVRLSPSSPGGTYSSPARITQDFTSVPSGRISCIHVSAVARSSTGEAGAPDGDAWAMTPPGLAIKGGDGGRSAVSRCCSGIASPVKTPEACRITNKNNRFIFLRSRINVIFNK